MTFAAELPEAHVRYVARFILDGLGRLSQDAEDWLIEQIWFRQWVGEAASDMIWTWVYQHGWDLDPPAFWPDDPKDIYRAEEIAGKLGDLPRTRL